ncbi:MAG: Na/Pi cotransporter family protein [Oscillospiraceae bacterium]|nr:Na/Pi cotransporter family protein [Oscillospiraceae bacterium]
MGITEIAALLGGLALFLYGMKMMSDGLEQAAGDKLRKILEKLTSNRFLGVAVGAGITAVIQSSSATTVMVVGFVNSGLMTLRQAIWIIMGANIGTTITGQLIALDVSAAAPFFAAAGVVLIMFFKSKKLYHTGHIIGGLGILFIGMTMMSDSMSGLRDSKLFTDVVTNLSNPFLGVAAGAVFTAIIQSSSASVGILQALSAGGAISLKNSVYVLFGQNIGTCITAVLASVSTSRNARRTTIIHLMFNVIGTTVFIIICQLFNFADWVESLTPDNTAAQIANVHTIFNVVTTLLLIPFGELLEKAAKKILPEMPDEKEDITKMELNFISPSSLINHTIGSVSVAISQIHGETAHMYQIAVKNVEDSFDNVMLWDEKRKNKIEKNEEYVDFLNAEISKYISSIMSTEMTQQDALAISAYFQLIGNIERISDHAVNISDYSELLHEKGVQLSEMVFGELEEMKNTALRILKSVDFSKPAISTMVFTQISMSEERIDKLTEVYRNNQLDRMKNNQCSGDISVIYSEMITDFERIGDHMLNIAECMLKI